MAPSDIEQTFVLSKIVLNWLKGRTANPELAKSRDYDASMQSIYFLVAIFFGIESEKGETQGNLSCKKEVYLNESCTAETEEEKLEETEDWLFVVARRHRLR
jgi:hypothetical protein